MSREHVSLELRHKTSSEVRTNEGRLFQVVGWGRSIRTDEQPCMSMKTVLTVGTCMTVT